jgi:stage V sporulation protein S
MDVIKVSAGSRTSAVAGAIAGVIREHHSAVVQAIGAGAINQAIKALVLATGYLKSDGIEVSFVPEFVDISIEDKIRTGIRLVITPTANSDFSAVSPTTTRTEIKSDQTGENEDVRHNVGQ